ncbi:MAG: ABC transporter permease, partial [Planktotalea sp.]
MQILQNFGIRAGYAVILLLAVLVLNFSMMHMAPGDVADTISQSMGGADQEVLDRIRADYGLDQPFYVQLARYIGNV